MLRLELMLLHLMYDLYILSNFHIFVSDFQISGFSRSQMDRKTSPSINTAYDVLRDLDSQEQTRASLHHARLERSPGLGHTVRSSLLCPHESATVPLSPLVQRTPGSGRTPGVECSQYSYEKDYDGFMVDDSLLESGDTDHSCPRARSRVSTSTDRDGNWNEPGKGLGKITLGGLIATALGLLGFLMFMGKAIDDADKPHKNPNPFQHSQHSVESELASFPFSPSHYLNECTLQGQDDGDNSTFSWSGELPGPEAIREEPIRDSYFSPTLSEKEHENKKKYAETDEDGHQICAKTLTYLLDDDFGFTFHLNAIALAASLAEKDSRAFFIVDAEWDRGSWNDHFISMPSPGCAPPPPSELVGCPRSARHWILTSSIFPPHFSKEFQYHFGNNQDLDKPALGFEAGIIPYTRKTIYEMARSTFSRLFILSDENDQLIRQTKQEIIKSAIWGPSLNEKLPPFISVHIRKGDRHPHDPLHRFDYLPINDFIESINSTWTRLRQSDNTLPESPNVYLASDTPLTLQQIRALTPPAWNFFHLSESGPESLNSIAHPHEYSQLHFHSHILSERVGYTRGQIIDMAFFGGWPQSDGSVRLSSTDFDKPLASICTVSSNMCQFGALQIGWEEAFENSSWINLDLPHSASWTGIEIPAPNTGDSNKNGHGHGQGHSGAHHSHR